MTTKETTRVALTNLTIFKSNEFGLVRVKEVDGEPMFVARDIAIVLGYKKPENAISAHCKGSLKQGILTNGGIQEVSMIPESDVYRLIFRSKLPTATRFSDWVFDEVLPQIRKTGKYDIEKKSDILLLAERVIELDRENKLLSHKINLDKPKIAFSESVASSSDSMLIRDFAKAISNKFFKIGQNRLFLWLRKHNYLMPDNTPYQKFIDNGYFELIERAVGLPDKPRIVTTTKITGTGQVALSLKIMNSFTDSKQGELI